MNKRPFLPDRRLMLRAGLAGSVAAVAGCRTATAPVATAASSRPRLTLLGEAQLPHKARFRGTTVGGLSGLDFDPASGRWMAISDDRSDLQPARFYLMRMPVAAGQPVAPELVDVVTLRGANGRPYPPLRLGGEVVDPEACRFLPGGRGMLWTSEGAPRLNLPPSLHEARLDGSHVRTFRIPPHFGFGPPGTGPRGNKTFEGLALTPDGQTAWVGMEAALEQDGPVPRVGTPGGPCRFTAFDVARGEAVRQIAYLPDAIPRASPFPWGFTDGGVSEILMADAHRMLVLERAYMLGVGTSLRLYEIDTQAGSNTLALEQLRPGAYTPAPKRLVADLETLGLSRLDNTEGMAWGPRLGNGHRSLVMVSDDNFNPVQVTQFVAFDYQEQ